MALTAELTSFYDSFLRSAPAPVSSAFRGAAKENETEFDAQRAVQVGDKLPDFSGLDEAGKALTREELLDRGPLLIRFHRGGWCPLCNIEMRALQEYAQQFFELGVTLVMVSPDPPQESLSRKENMKLDFLMLSDSKNELAGKLGIVARQPEALRPVFATMTSRFDDPKQSLNVPLSATLLVDRNGTIRQSSINPRYPERLEPETALEWIKTMNQVDRNARDGQKSTAASNVIELTRSMSGYGWGA